MNYEIEPIFREIFVRVTANLNDLTLEEHVMSTKICI